MGRGPDRGDSPLWDLGVGFCGRWDSIRQVLILGDAGRAADWGGGVLRFGELTRALAVRGICDDVSVWGCIRRRGPLPLGGLAVHEHRVRRGQGREVAAIFTHNPLLSLLLRRGTSVRSDGVLLDGWVRGAAVRPCPGRAAFGGQHWSQQQGELQAKRLTWKLLWLGWNAERTVILCLCRITVYCIYDCDYELRFISIHCPGMHSAF